jgi:DNA-directed RNA polymerase specialized sigma24 family protein
VVGGSGDDTTLHEVNVEVVAIKMQGTDETIDPLMVKRALAQLSAEHRAVLWRSHYLGWSLAHIAADLQIAEGTVKSRLHDALRAVMRTLQDGRESDGG